MRSRNVLLAVAAFLSTAVTSHPAYADTPQLLGQMFQDHAVLQRDQPIAIWGSAASATRVTIDMGGHSVRAEANAQGRWQATLPAFPAGGPYTLTVRTSVGASQSISDVLIGDVFLCSGQSNMEYAMSASMNASQAIARSADDRLRLLTISHAYEPARRDQFNERLQWAAATPQTVQSFSAVCYYFARELAKTVDAPIGLIHAAVGGSNIETWISPEALRGLGGFDDRLELLQMFGDDRQAAYRRFSAEWQTWWRTQSAASPWMDATSIRGWRPAPAPMRDWKTWGVAALADHDGMVWFRREVRLTARQAASEASIALGAIDDVDHTWINGQPIGASFGATNARTYALPAGLLREGANTIVVNALSLIEAGGMLGPDEHVVLRFSEGDQISLSGGWRYQIAPALTSFPPSPPWFTIGGVSGAYNGMIAPMGAYGLRGVLWYQGESNAGEAGAYQGLLRALMSDWRHQFARETLPFLVVQLPNIGRPPNEPVASGWADLREAQRRAVLEDHNAGLAVTIDLGSPIDIHPPNKQPVGERLARVARRLIYGETINASGPEPLSATEGGGRILVRFRSVEGALTAFSGVRPVGFELCAEQQASCRFVDAHFVAPDAVLLDVPPGLSAQRVRYCWGDGPIGTLSDRSGLPVGPFELVIAQSE